MAINPTGSEVTGLNQALQALHKVGAASETELKGIMFEAGLIVARAAIIPVDTGNLATTLRVGKGRTRSTVTVGGARAFYSHFVHKGAPARNIKPNPFLVEAKNRKQNEITDTVEKGIKNIIQKYGLE